MNSRLLSITSLIVLTLAACPGRITAPSGDGAASVDGGRGDSAPPKQDIGPRPDAGLLPDSGSPCDSSPGPDQPPPPDSTSSLPDAPSCTPQCAGKKCGESDGCAGTCYGPCAGFAKCDSGSNTCKCGPSPHYKWVGGLCKASCGKYLGSKGWSDGKLGCCAKGCKTRSSGYYETHDCAWCCESFSGQSACQ